MAASSQAPAVDPAIDSAIVALARRYAMVVDSKNVEAWPELFAEVASYQVIPRHNLENSLPVSLVLDDSRGRIEDRVYFIQKIWRGNFTDYSPRHLFTILDISPLEGAPGRFRVISNFAVYFVEASRHSGLLASGQYRDIVTFESGEPRYAEKQVITDAAVLPRYFVYPL